ncbi:MAG: hypothetical protein EP330_24440 [Deltaproteobacteria bacterium]|nr:MAG: hypothetical protein EP330_24440 [Deltaproteobacteria bacterium]
MTRSLALLPLLAACSAGDMALTERETGDPLDTATEGDTDGTPDLPAATWVALSGTLLLADGSPDLTASSLTWTYYDGEMAEICTYVAPVATAADLTLPDPALYTWWALTTDDSADDGSCLTRPVELNLGLGAIDGSLAPAMDAAEVDDAAAPYGLYAQVGWEAIDAETPVWIFGLAGTAGAFDGTEPAVGAAPLPDGSYELQPLHLFAVP